MKIDSEGQVLAFARPPPQPQSQLQPLELAVVVPTRNEAGNVAALVAALDRALAGIAWEAIFVDDDSPDGTAGLLRDIGRRDRRIRVIQRIGRRGLSSAVVEGALATAAPVVAVIDGDMQHDETLLPALFAAINGSDGEPPCDLVVGSRYTEGAVAHGFTKARAFGSRLATRLSQTVMRTPIADPMSGFFMARQALILDAAPRLSNVGFKILLDLVASSPRAPVVREIAYRFRPRHAGTSKLDARVVHEFLVLLLDKLVGRWIPVRFLLFAAVGTLGLGVNLAAIWLGLRLGLYFAAAQTVAVLIAMTGNFVLNNAVTYHDMRLRGAAMFRGLLSYYAVCLVGAAGNIGVGSLVFNADHDWRLAGVAGALVAVVWNYAATSLVTWRSPSGAAGRVR